MRREKAISAADATRRLPALLRAVQRGESVLITRRGKAVARLVPVVSDDQADRVARVAALSRLGADRVVRLARS